MYRNRYTQFSDGFDDHSCESCAMCSWFEAHVEMHDNNMQCESPDGVIPGSPDSGTPPEVEELGHCMLLDTDFSSDPGEVQ